MQIQVLEEDIAFGKPKDRQFCPIALAIIRELNDPWVDVGNLTIQINDHIYNLPENAVRFIRRFDRGDYVQPFSFNLGE